ncbi:hypothetical protein BC937DRAFT_94128 [Endogone sp. FLAS-F59071]|nr:hypothetical protein BC937DRAFT_94128 [Endogone sp. FLAS-F59071]|eukprot:RUS14248.1 hypothetical protein BC937DRAFT_94128 [Endogone sp. FLAS-F59071]
MLRGVVGIGIGGLSSQTELDVFAVGITYTTDIHSGIELRRTSHKAAEQKRRDSLKRCFDDLRGVIPDVTERNPSKVYLLKKSYDYILQLKTQGHSKDRRILSLKTQIREMREHLGLPLESDDEDDEAEKSGEGFKQGMNADARVNETDDEDDSDGEGESTNRRGVKNAREARTDASKGDA